MRSELVRLWAEHNTAAGDTTQVDAEYLEVVATRNGAQDAPGPHLLKKEEAPASRRAALLADRIEQGAAGLAAFAEGISEAEWHLPVSSTDHRSVGVIVHHVASMYPIEIDVARAVAAGNAVTMLAGTPWHRSMPSTLRPGVRDQGRNAGTAAQKQP